VSTTKLTRKEISADPIHDALVSTIEVLRTRARIIMMIAAGVILVAVIAYFGLRYLESRNSLGQQELAKGIDYYHGLIDAKAQEDPYFTSNIHLQTFIRALRSAEHPPVDPDWVYIEDILEKAVEEALFGSRLVAQPLLQARYQIEKLKGLR